MGKAKGKSAKNTKKTVGSEKKREAAERNPRETIAELLEKGLQNPRIVEDREVYGIIKMTSGNINTDWEGVLLIGALGLEAALKVYAEKKTDWISLEILVMLLGAHNKAITDELLDDIQELQQEKRLPVKQLIQTLRSGNSLRLEKG